MMLSEVKKNLNKLVIYKPLGIKYLLTACILRENVKKECFYQAELQDAEAPHSVIICRLEDVEGF